MRLVISSKELAYVEIIAPEGRITRSDGPSNSPPTPLAEQPVVVAYEYFFEDWSEPEDAISLCEQYLTEVRRIVSDGMARGYLTE